MEYRAWITVPGLDLEDEHRWAATIDQLEQCHAELGPVIGFDDGVARFVLSTEAASAELAAGVTYAAIAGTLHAVGHGELTPSTIEIHPAHIDVARRGPRTATGRLGLRAPRE